jgi:hypothetical protein
MAVNTFEGIVLSLIGLGNNSWAPADSLNQRPTTNNQPPTPKNQRRMPPDIGLIPDLHGVVSAIA